MLAGTVVYLNSLSAPFIFDDQTAILDNPQIRQLWPLSVPLSPRREIACCRTSNRQPDIRDQLRRRWAGVRGYRLTNLAIHLLAALTLFGLVRRTLQLPSLAPTFGTHATNLAWVSALVWMLHPLQTEVIDYVTQRTESMMGLCYLLTMYFSVRALERHPGRWQAAAVLACATGMACKESMVTAPVMVGLFDYVFVSRAMMRKVHRPRLYIGLASTWLVLAALMAPGPRTTVGFNTAVSGWTYLLNQAPILLTYLRLTFWPRNLVIDYGAPSPFTLADVWLPMIAVIALGVVVLVLLARRRHAGFLGAWCFITLGTNVQHRSHRDRGRGDRRMYLPLAALVVLLVLWRVSGMGSARDRSSQHSSDSAVAIGVCVLLAAATIQRNREYRVEALDLQTAVARRPHPRSYLMLETRCSRQAGGRRRCTTWNWPRTTRALASCWVSSSSPKDSSPLEPMNSSGSCEWHRDIPGRRRP